MNADQEALQIEKGETSKDPSGFEQGWFSRIRARKKLGDNVNKKPFTRQWGSTKVASSPMNQDKITAIADAVGYRRVAINKGIIPDVVDVGDMLLIQWEYFLLTADPKILAQAAANAAIVKQWPVGYQGVADFEVGT